jgi:hypothetical protein
VWQFFFFFFFFFFLGLRALFTGGGGYLCLWFGKGNAMGGYVYAIANDAMPCLVKIGATLRNPEDRLNEARATTWAPSWWGFPHALLARRRFDGRREFFVMTHEEAIALLALVVPSAVRSASADQSPPVAAFAATAVHPSPEERLRAWVDANYTRIPLREKDSGTKLEALHGAYIASAPARAPEGARSEPIRHDARADLSRHRSPQGTRRLSRHLLAALIALNPLPWQLTGDGGVRARHWELHCRRGVEKHASHWPTLVLT